MIRKTVTLDLTYVAMSHFDYEAGLYVVIHGDAYNELLYCDGTCWFYEVGKGNFTTPFKYSDEIQWIAKWEGFPVPSTGTNSADEI